MSLIYWTSTAPHSGVPGSRRALRPRPYAVRKPKQYAVSQPAFPPRGRLSSFGPNSILEGDVYLVAGDPPVDISTPVTTLDAPVPNQRLSGTFSMAGWSFDETAVARVDVYIDGTLVGTATYGIPRLDVAQDWPNAPPNVGFTFSLNTATFPNGNHTIQIRATDTNSNVAVLPDVPVTIQN